MPRAIGCFFICFSCVNYKSMGGFRRFALDYFAFCISMCYSAGLIPPSGASISMFVRFSWALDAKMKGIIGGFLFFFFSSNAVDHF